MTVLALRSGQGGASTARSGPAEEEQPVPLLREDLQLMAAGNDAGHHAGHMIFDPVRNAYFRIPPLATQVLSVWQLRYPTSMVQALGQRGIAVTANDITAIAGFVERNSLIQTASGGTAGIARKIRGAHKSILTTALHNYLFFRIPLFRPQAFLVATYPLVGWLGAWPMRVVYVLMALAGLYLAGHQWDEFRNTFLHFLSLEGLVLYAITLAGVKVVHELGHAYVATRYGVRVPHMGVAFMVLLPMLYTEVSDAWRLTSRRQKLMIDLAGVMAELVLACTALLAWSFLPDGPSRSAAFFIATTAWVMSLAVNLSPFMRFDGYHVMADALAIHNLQPRSFAQGRTVMRNVLFGLRNAPPEQFSPGLHRLLVAYAWATWVYRFFLFLGIALIVYHMSFKLLGIGLAAVEIAFFLAKPIYAEIREWFAMKQQIIGEGRWKPRLLVVLVALALLFVPFDSRVHVAAVLGAAGEEQHFAPEPARVAAVHVASGQLVSAGDLLVVLDAPDLVQLRALAGLRLDLAEHRLARIAADSKDRANLAVLQREQAMRVREIEGYADRQRRLEIRAQGPGRVTSLLPGLVAGMWVGTRDRLVHVARQGRFVARGVVSERDVARLGEGATGRFIADDPALAAVAVTLQSISTGTSAARELQLLSSTSGGQVDATLDGKGSLHTSAAMFPISFVTTSGPADGAGWQREVRGTVVATGVRRSIARRIAERVISVILRETGF